MDKKCSLIDYEESLKISGYTFYGIVESLKMIADDDDLACVKQEWPADGLNWDRVEARKIVIAGHSFNGLLGALVRKADTMNLRHIENQWPTFAREFVTRVNADGVLDTG